MLMNRLFSSSIGCRQKSLVSFGKALASTAALKPNEDLVDVTVDGKTMMIDKKMTVLQACSLAGVEIPRFCYHERLSVAGNCRMCLVEVDKVPKPVASCAWPVQNGMIISTNSPMVMKAREGVMEFLLINHPLDCPICDQGGECDLQDQSMVFGSDRSRFTDVNYYGKRAVSDKDIGPVVQMEMTRCIQCTRCTRFSNEIAGVADLGTTGRGNDMQIGTYVDKMFATELSGNVIDLCPVGALTSKQYRFKARPWETRKTESIDITDAVGSNIIITHRSNDILRILPRLNESINEEWISDRTRFSSDSNYLQRLTTPMMRNERNELVECSWQDVLSKLKNEMSKRKKWNASIGSLCDVESMFALRDLFIHQNQTTKEMMTEEIFPTKTNDRYDYLFNSKISGLDECDALLLVGTNPRYEAAIINARIRKNWLNNQLEIGYIGDCLESLNYQCHDLGKSFSEAIQQFKNTNSSFGKIWNSAKNPMIILGSDMMQKMSLDDRKNIFETTKQFALAKEKKLADKDWKVFNYLHTKASQVGAMDLQLNYQDGIDGIIKNQPDFLYLLHNDKKIDRNQLPKNCFIVYQGSHGNENAQYADIILPGATFAEKTGLYINTEGLPQSTTLTVTSPGRSRIDWKIIRAISEVNDLHPPYTTLEQLRRNISLISKQLTTIDQYPNERASSNVSATNLPISQLKLSPVKRKLTDFYMTDVYTENSKTMAACAAAAKKNESNEYLK
ncbi:hypothetical protein SNEBB_003339 [Seison nebaliae]|nr:hypothetical protein SNEBB_003339 [Seison nebaliae]